MSTCQIFWKKIFFQILALPGCCRPKYSFCVRCKFSSPLLDKRLRECVQLLDDYKLGKATASDKELWRAQKIKQAILHPDTGEKVLAPFRMSGFVPFGWITVTGMLLPNPSWPTLLFWQWMNQSHNACVNYANRNATQPQPLSTYVGAYVAAVGAACSISAGMSHTKAFLSVIHLEIKVDAGIPGLTYLIKKSTSLPATTQLIVQAVTDTTLVRAFLPVPLLLAPPCIMPFLERYKWVSGSPWRHLFVNAIVCTLSFAASLPVALALFPQESTNLFKIATSALEPEIQSKTNSEQLFYNKGL
ncbi:tricarboxylate carrier [Ancylostoma duodenale]|uniref:Tricarboxylate carrier n=1 Tax=Ancylostoma duodenale TaxID=51022 RepID=A0A0C2GZK9_9BILA|nr:tricarboxylate carrier [Ancylostoma duodenale]